MTFPKYGFYDFDNCMMETEKHALPSLIARFNNLYGKQLEEPLTLDVFKTHFKGMARESLCAKMSEHFGITVDCATLYDKREPRMMQHMKQIDGGIVMAPGLLESMYGLKDRAVQFAFVSNNPIQRGLAAMRCADNGRGTELAHMFGANFFEAGDVQKPKPDVYLMAMEQLDTDTADCFAVEDSLTGAAAAIDAGIVTFGYTGFCSNPEQDGKKLVEKGCLFHFDNWADFNHRLELVYENMDLIMDPGNKAAYDALSRPTLG